MPNPDDEYTRIPFLEHVKARTSVAEYSAILMLADNQIANLDGCTLEPRLIAMALGVAATLYAVSLSEANARLGRETATRSR
jgi:hypothetical protein